MNKNRLTKDQAFVRKPLITALEPRVLLDGAAVATTAEMTTDVDYQQPSPVPAEASATESNEPRRREVAFVDTSIKNYQSIVGALDESTDVFLINSRENGLDVILAALQGQSDIDGIHIFSHGSEGEVRLGNSIIDNDNLGMYANQLEQLGGSLASTGDILLYGCYVGTEGEGRDFIERFSLLTGADVNASDDLTGASSLGGDWELETSTGDIETQTYSVAEFQGVLVPVISDLIQSLSFTEGGSSVIIDNDITISGGSNYTEGYIRFSVEDANTGDQFTLTSGANVNTNGAISVDGNDVYLGNGSGRDRIGSIDEIENGKNGKALKILFSSPLPNSGFEDGQANWTIKNEQYGDDTDEISFDNYSIPLANDGVYSGGTGTTNVQLPSGMNYNGSVVSGQGVDDSDALNLSSNGNIQKGDQLSPNGGKVNGYGSIHGPYATSSVITVQDGDSLSLDFRAVGDGDDYEVFGLLRRVDAQGDFINSSNTGTENNRDNIVLFAERGNDTQGYKTVSYTNLQTGSYRFQFVGGTYDHSGGYYVGSNLYVDNIRLISSTSVNNSVASTIARQVAYQNTADDAPVSRKITVAAADASNNIGSADITLTITSTNDAPSFLGNASLTAVNEDTTAPTGASISSLFGSVFTDPDSQYGPTDSLSGVVITGDSSTDEQGQWQYSVNGTDWLGIGEVSPEQGLMLSSETLVRFVPEANYYGSVGSLSAHTVDDSGALSFSTHSQREVYNTGQDNQTSQVSDTATQLITSVAPQNDDPVLSDASSGNVNEANSALTANGTLKITDIDILDTVTLSWTASTNSASSLVPGNTTLKNMLSFDTSPALSNGETTKELDWNFNSGSEHFDFLKAGETLTLTYVITANDGSGGTDTQDIVITINGTDDVPVQSVPGTQIVNEETDLVFSDANDNAISINLTDDETHTTTVSIPEAAGILTVVNTGGVVQISGSNTGSVTLTGTQTQINAALQGLTLKPAKDHDTDFALTITTSDNITTDTDTVTIDITPVNDEPTLVAGEPSNALVEAGGINNESTGVSQSAITLTSGDVDTGDSAKFDTIWLVNEGWSASDDGATYVKGGTYGSATLTLATGTLAYQLNNGDADTEKLATNEQATDSFVVQVIDIAGATGSITTEFDVNGRNDVPEFSQQSTTKALEEIDGALTTSGSVTIRDEDLHDTASMAVSSIAAEYKDPDGNVISNRTPPASEDLLAMLSTDNLAEVIDNSSQQAMFNWSFNSGTESFDSLRKDEQLILTYTLTLTDSQDTSTTHDIEIVITGTNDAPGAVNDTGFATETSGSYNETPGTDAAGNVLSNDKDKELGTGDEFTVIGIENHHNVSKAVSDNADGVQIEGTYGSLIIKADGSYTYIINNEHEDVQALKNNETLTDTFTYTVKDLVAATDRSSLTITIHGRNDTPDTEADTGNATEQGGNQNASPGSDANGLLLDNDRDVEGEAFTLTSIKFGDNSKSVSSDTSIDGNYGILTVSRDGSYAYVIDNNNDNVQALKTGSTLEEIFTYTVTDEADGESTQTLTIAIAGSNDQPVVDGTNIDQKWPFGKSYQNDVSKLFSDVDSADNGEVLTFSADGLPKGIDINAQTGVISGAAKEFGLFTVSLKVTDLEGASVSRQFQLNIQPPPVSDDSGAGGSNGTTQSGSRSGNNSDNSGSGWDSGTGAGSGSFGTDTGTFGSPTGLPGFEGGDTPDDHSGSGSQSGSQGNGASNSNPGTGGIGDSGDTSGSGDPLGTQAKGGTGNLSDPGGSGHSGDSNPSGDTGNSGGSGQSEGNGKSEESDKSSEAVSNEESGDASGKPHASDKAVRAVVDVHVNTKGELVLTEGSQQEIQRLSMDIAAIRVVQETIEVPLVDLQSDMVEHYSATIKGEKILPDWIRIDPETGYLRITPLVGQDSLVIEVEAIDLDGNSRILEINLNLKELMENTLPEGNNHQGFQLLNDQLMNKDTISQEVSKLIIRLQQAG